MKRIDRTGHRFGRLKAIKFIGVNKRHNTPNYGKTFWKFKCDCGKEKVLPISSSLMKNKVKSCGCLRKEKEDHSGKQFGRWTVLKFSHRASDGHTQYWLAKCSCGTQKPVKIQSMKKGTSKSCGCYAIESVRRRKPRLTHGLSRTSFESRYYCLRRRCTNKKDKSYKRYGGRGIKCEWKTFEEFKNDMYESYTEYTKKYASTKRKDVQIDRIDNDGNYCKENCRWATAKEQARNRRSNKYFTVKNQTMLVQDWAEQIGIHRATIYKRFKLGWSIEKALTQPGRIKNKRKQPCSS